MKEPIIDDFVKAYLVACLVSGIHVEAEPHDFMVGLVDHMNGLKERVYWAQGDEDGVIIHDKFDMPIMSLTYRDNALNFMLFDQDEYLELGMNRDAGFMLLNIIGYIRDNNLPCEPVAMRQSKIVVPPPSQQDQEDWAL